MPIQTYRPKREKSVQAIQLTFDAADEVARWCGGRKVEEVDPFDSTKKSVGLNIPTLEGVVRASEGDWIIQDFEGGFRIMDAASFEHSYERPKRGEG